MSLDADGHAGQWLKKNTEKGKRHDNRRSFVL